jgi:AraC-like DNA-binding protein
MSVGRWRQQARLLHAMRLLARGEPVTSIALEVGYESPSAFIATFKSVLGTTPGSYFRPRGQRRADQNTFIKPTVG